MYSASDLRKGLKIEIDGSPYVITDFTFTKPGKGQSIYTCKMKNLINGNTMTKQYRSVEKIKKPALSEKNLEFSYIDAHEFVFMNEDYEQIMISDEIIGEDKFYLEEGIMVDILYHNGKPIGITMPNFVVRAIAHTEPGAKGNTATNVVKPAEIATGLVLQVPIFINTDDKVRIDTRTGKYVERV
jgi:elongation factor P